MIHRNTLNCHRFLGNHPARPTRDETHIGLLQREPQEMALVTGHGAGMQLHNAYTNPKVVLFLLHF